MKDELKQIRFVFARFLLKIERHVLTLGGIQVTFRYLMALTIEFHHLDRLIDFGSHLTVQWKCMKMFTKPESLATLRKGVRPLLKCRGFADILIKDA
jgi:hypothetical protein